MKSIGQAIKEMALNIVCTIEKWKPIKNYEGLYEVSNLGRVKSLNYNRTKKEKILNPRYNKNYLSVSLHKNKNQKTFYIHKLVAETFIDNPNNLPCVNHIDGNKLNNEVKNLEFCSYSKNNLHAYDIGLKDAKKVIQYDLQGNFIKEWISGDRAGEILKINKSNIHQCCKGKRKTAGGFKWRYANEKYQ